MEIILTFLGIIVVIFLIKLCFIAVLHIVVYGIVLFFLVGMPIGFAWLIGWMESDTAWTICKWAFYIGSAYGLLHAILHPSEYFGNVFNDLNTDSSSSSRSHSSHYSSNSSSDDYDGGGYCSNCSRFRSGEYCSIGHRMMSESTSSCKEGTYC